MSETKTNFVKGIEAFFGTLIIFALGLSFVNGNIFFDTGTIILISFIAAVISGIYFTFFDTE